jgi:hypothetical protein
MDQKEKNGSQARRKRNVAFTSPTLGPLMQQGAGAVE